MAKKEVRELINREEVREIKELTNKIDHRINIFEGFYPKSLVNCSGEILYWKEIVSLYGLFVDCDRVQIKETNNLFDLLKRYSYITETEYENVRLLFRDISDARSWFCHNNNDKMNYVSQNNGRIKKYLSKSLPISSRIPNDFDDFSETSDWKTLADEIYRRYGEYLQILKGGLNGWYSSSESKKELLISDWIDCFSGALYNDGNLIENALADIALLRCVNPVLKGKEQQMVMSYREFLKTNISGREVFDVQDIKKYLASTTKKQSNLDIVICCIKDVLRKHGKL